jgi:hypothetical protein
MIASVERGRQIPALMARWYAREHTQSLVSHQDTRSIKTWCTLQAYVLRATIQALCFLIQQHQWRQAAFAAHSE